MHVDDKKFYELLRRDEGFRNSEMIEAIAAAIQENYRNLMRSNGWPVPPKYDKPYAQLADIDKETNRAAARRIPHLLAMIGLQLVRQNSGDPAKELSSAQVRAYLQHHREMLAEEEHVGWVEERLAAGWRHGVDRCDARRIHNRLVDYDPLPEHEKDKDRESIDKIPDVVTSAGYRIVLDPEGVLVGDPGN